MSLSWRDSVRFSNLVVHNDQEIEGEMVFNIGHHQLDDFRAYAQAVVPLLSQS